MKLKKLTWSSKTSCTPLNSFSYLYVVARISFCILNRGPMVWSNNFWGLFDEPSHWNLNLAPAHQPYLAVNSSKVSS